jgi:hypothetical protein
MVGWHGRWPVLVLALVGAIFAAPGRADYAEKGAAMCERAIVNGAAREGVPQEVLHAISLTETGRPQGGRLRPWPWAINREGQGHWFKTREEALAFARASLAEGRKSFDVSCFQINYRHHGHNFPSLEAMFDPDVAASYAARFLRSLYRGDWSKAAGAYHSQTPHFAGIYRARFDRILAGLGGQPLAVAAATEEPAESAAPRKSRTRMASKPLIITIEKDPGDGETQPPAQEAFVMPAPGRDDGFVPASGGYPPVLVITTQSSSPR